MNKKEMLSVSIIMGSKKHRPWNALELESLADSPSVRIANIFIDQSFDKTPDKENKNKITELCSLLDKIWRNKYKSLIFTEIYISALLTSNKIPYQEYKEWGGELVSIDSISKMSEIERTYFSSKKHQGKTYTIPDEIVDKIVDESEVVVLIGFNRILRGRILNEPKYGTINIHWSNIKKYRGRPGCFWQFINDEEEIGITVQRLSEDLDAGDIIYDISVDISDAVSLHDVKIRSRKAYGTLLTTAIQNLNRSDFAPESLNKEELGTLTYEDESYNVYTTYKVLLKHIKNRYLN